MQVLFFVRILIALRKMKNDNLYFFTADDDFWYVSNQVQIDKKLDTM